MPRIIEALYKSADKIQFGWNPESGAASYKVYVGLVAGSLVLLKENISAWGGKHSANVGKVVYNGIIEDVQTVLTLPATTTFANTSFYFARTLVDANGTETPLSESTVSEIPPVGVTVRYRRDDPSAVSNMFGFTEDSYRWVKLAASNNGGLIVDSNEYYKTNLVTEYTYDGTNILTVKAYPSDSTTVGAPAKLTSYEYSGGLVSKITVTDSTV